MSPDFFMKTYTYVQENLNSDRFVFKVKKYMRSELRYAICDIITLKKSDYFARCFKTLFSLRYISKPNVYGRSPKEYMQCSEQTLSSGM